MSIRVTDEASRLVIVDLTMSLEDFAKCITGQYSKCEITRVPTPEIAGRLGREKEIMKTFCNKVGHEKDKQKAEVLRDFREKWESLGWSIDSDGTGTQQSAQGHCYTICRWLEKEAE